MTALGYMTEFGITTEETAKWHEINVSADQADTFGLLILGISLVVFGIGYALRKATAARP
jgi:hypothetical protein